MKTLFLIFTFFICYSFTASAEGTLFHAHPGTQYLAINAKDNTVFGTIKMRGDDRMTFYYGADRKIWLNGAFRIDEHESGSKLVAKLVDDENTTIWVDTALMQVDLTNVNLEELDLNPNGVSVSILIWVDGAKKPSTYSVILKKI